MNCKCGQALDELPATCPRCGCWLIPLRMGGAERVVRFLESSVGGVAGVVP